MRGQSVNGSTQNGFSLVELMVAMVVSLLLLIGILQILLGNRDSFDSQRALAGIQQDARLGSFVLEHAIAHAGYMAELKEKREILFDNGFVEATNGGGVTPDGIRIRYQSEGGLSDCRGQAVGGADAEITDFQLRINDQHQLECEVFTPGNTGTEIVLDNVENLQFLYALDTDEDDSVDTFSNTLDANQLEQVRSVRAQMILVGDYNVLPSAVEQTFTFADGQSVSFDDRRPRQMIDLNIALRNLLP